MSDQARLLRRSHLRGSRMQDIPDVLSGGRARGHGVHFRYWNGEVAADGAGPAASAAAAHALSGPSAGASGHQPVEPNQGLDRQGHPQAGAAHAHQRATHRPPAQG